MLVLLELTSSLTPHWFFWQLMVIFLACDVRKQRLTFQL